MKLYKLTDKEGYTRKDCDNEVKWKKGFTLTIPSVDYPRLCTSDVIHAYSNLNLGIFLNPIHAGITDLAIWEAEGEVCCQDYGKIGTFSLTTTRRLRVPSWYRSEDRRKRVVVQLAILCAESVLGIFESKYPNDSRPRTAIEAARLYLKNPHVLARADDAAAAARAAYAAARAAYDAAAARAAYAAAAAYDAARAAYADAVARAAYDADRAAYDAAAAAYDAARAAYDAAAAAYDAAAHAADAIDFGRLADQAVELQG